MAASRKLIDENAQMSCECEPGCRRFAVLVPKGANDRIFLYEIYESRAAFGTPLAVAAPRHIQHDQRRPGRERERC
jgi:quinol monooxygenase YgiN